MKIISWNCQGAFRKKIDRLNALRPDIAIIQEAEAIEKIEGLQNLNPNQVIRYGENPHKGILVYASDVQRPLPINHLFKLNCSHFGNG